MTPSKQVHLNITFKNTEPTDALKNYSTDKISNLLKKFVHHDTEVRLVLKVEKTRHSAEVTFNADGHNFHCSEQSTDLYASIDKLIDALQNQLRKHKEKLTSHH